MMLFFRQEKEKRSFDLHNWSCLVNTNDQFLTNNICCKMFLSRINMTSLPEYTDPFKEREDNADDNFFNPDCCYLLVQNFFKSCSVKIHHHLYQFIHNPFLLRTSQIQFCHSCLHIIERHFIYM